MVHDLHDDNDDNYRQIGWYGAPLIYEIFEYILW